MDITPRWSTSSFIVLYASKWVHGMTTKNRISPFMLNILDKKKDDNLSKMLRVQLCLRGHAKSMSLAQGEGGWAKR